MAKRGAVYPQVAVTAGALVEPRVIACPPGCRVAAALERTRRAQAAVLVLGRRSAARQRDLLCASRWHLGGLPVATVAWHGLPTLSARAPEVEARRLILGGAPLVVVRNGRQALGVIDSETAAIARPSLSLGRHLDRVEPRWGGAGLGLLRVAGKLGEASGTPVYAVGGFVRDLLMDRPSRDVDIVVEGDGVAFARRLSEEVGGRLVLHPAFGTASLGGVGGSGGSSLARIDIASARRERYDAPGALPLVSRATIEEDLRRRDFSVNAMAMTLWPSGFGRLLDPLGGRLDLKRRRLRPLSPLSFVEDPTRVFRAARYAARFGFRLDDTGMTALRLALRGTGYPALSGQRLRAELDRLVAEPSGWRGIELLLKWGALSIWDQGYRMSPFSTGRVRAAARLAAWARRVGVEVDPGEVALIALLLDQRSPVVARSLARLAVSGNALAGLRAAPEARRLDGARVRRRSEVAELLQAHPTQALVAIWLQGGRRARRRVEWFWSRGRAVRPLLSGDDVVALGVRRGPGVGACLAALRRRRLDGAVSTIGQERAFVTQWAQGRSAEVRAEAWPSGRWRDGRPAAARRTGEDIGRAQASPERGAARPGHRGRYL